MCSIFKTTKRLLIILAVLTITSTAFALEMSSKRDCVVCHIMWLDDFRTDQESLVPFQPGNVLMKDTQGVVSSEDICYSCHDGYVKDSRHILGKFNRHPVFVKPSKNVKIPPELPLSVNGEIYCGTCHSAHGKGASAQKKGGRTSVFREVNIDSDLCEKCHRNQAAYSRSNGHPLHTKELKLPDRLFEIGAKKATEKNVVICQSCHRVHGAEGEKLVLVENSNSQLCVTCHTSKEGLINTKHDLSITMPGEKNLKGQTVSDSGPCSACHTPHNASGKKLWARPLKKGNPATQMCLTCHGEDTTYDIKHTGRYSHPINVELPANMETPDSLPLFSEDGSDNPKGRVQCFTCHNIHRWDPKTPSNRGGKNVEGNAMNSFLRTSNFQSAMCVECHAAKKQLVTSDHNLSVTAPEEENVQGFTPAESGPCGVCHIPHNAVTKVLWAKELSGEKDFVSQLCTTCHNENGAAREKLLGENYHLVDVTLDKFKIKTSLPLFDSDGNRMENGKIVCLTCHDPHTWDPDKPFLYYPFKNIEGDARNSFLRKSNSPTSGLCMTCHEDKAFVDGTDHDLNITAPEAVNLLGQTVKESGQCGVCHLVHNSPNKIKLWARDYGDVTIDEDVVDALCNSCHSDEKAGASRIPTIATHPELKLISNVFRNNRFAIDFAPLYDKISGKETSIGNISCPTCHNAHQWSPLVKAKGENKNLEGNATNSFLRNVSYNNICIDCHGLDAIFRYKYYHDPVERVEKPSAGANIIHIE